MNIIYHTIILFLSPTNLLLLLFIYDLKMVLVIKAEIPATIRTFTNFFSIKIFFFSCSHINIHNTLFLASLSFGMWEKSENFKLNNCQFKHWFINWIWFIFNSLQLLSLAFVNFFQTNFVFSVRRETRTTLAYFETDRFYCCLNVRVREWDYVCIIFSFDVRRIFKEHKYKILWFACIKRI